MESPKYNPNKFTHDNFYKNQGDYIDEPTNTDSYSQMSDKLILAVIVYMCLSSIFQFAMQHLVPNWYETEYRYIYVAVNMLWAAVPILLGIAIKNKDMKIAALLLGGLYALYIIYSNIEWMTSLMNY